MAKNIRDTKFKGFAQIVTQRLREQDLLNLGNAFQPLVTDDDPDLDFREVRTIIAQSMYDIVRHSLHSFDLITLECCESRDELLAEIPDLAEDEQLSLESL